jgi:hypothetical protein
MILRLLMTFVLLLSAGIVLAQDDTDGAELGDQSTVSIFVVICENQAVMNLSGNMEAGLDVYYQIFSGSNGSGEQLSSLRRAGVSGAYAVSEVIAYPEGKTIATGGIGSAYVTISVAGSPSDSTYNEYVDDIQDGCSDPQNQLIDSTVTEGDASLPDEGDTVEDDGTVVGPPILSPFGGFLNPNYTPYNRAEELAVGDAFVPPRQETPGLIFAECNGYRMADPGLIYDTDEITVFWSWYASTEEQVREHIRYANYYVTYHDNVLNNVIRTDIQEIGGDYWVFWYAQLGNRPPGYHHISLQTTWDLPITDGYSNFGPNTENPLLSGQCGFLIRPNPNGIAVSYNAWPFDSKLTWPPDGFGQ